MIRTAYLFDEDLIAPSNNVYSSASSCSSTFILITPMLVAENDNDATINIRVKNSGTKVVLRTSLKQSGQLIPA